MHQTGNAKITASRTIVIALAFTIAACATPEDMRARAPTATLQSMRPASEVAICIADRWDNEKILGRPVAAYGLRARATATGQIITVLNQYGGIMYMVDVIARDVGSTTNFYDYNIQDPLKVPTGLPLAYSTPQTQPYVSGMHQALIECST